MKLATHVHGDSACYGRGISCRVEKTGELTNTLGNPPESFYEPCSAP